MHGSATMCRSIQSWKLADLKRDDYAPNTPGQRQWEMDRKKWLAQRLVDVVKVMHLLLGVMPMQHSLWASQTQIHTCVGAPDVAAINHTTY